MREMKNSGIEWIGEIPEGWNVYRNKTCFDCSKEIVGDKSSRTQLLSLTTKGIKEKRAEDAAGKIPETYDTYQTVKPNDLVMCLFDLDVSAVFSGRSPYFGMISPAYKVLKCKEGIVFPTFADYWFSYIFDGRKFMHYAKNLRYTLNYDEFAVLPILLPPYDEQQRIAGFLNAECARIDAVIEQTRASIEEYKKLKQSVITQAVTKGIRPGRKMKASGVEWISEIPDGWSMVRGKGLFKEVDKRSEDGSEELLTVSQYTGVTPRSQKNVNMFEAETLEGYKICENGDIAANTMWLWAGAIGVSRYRGVISPSYNIYRQKDNVFNPTYLDYLLRATPLVQHYESLSTGIRASRLRLYPQQFLGIRYPVPPIEEQKEIVNYLKQKTGGMEVLIQKKEDYLSEIESYKKSLIFEYVTGKKEVSF